MGKVKKIEHARKEHTCNKCGKTIKVGEAYLKGELNFNPAIIRCESCGLAEWEVTTSEYALATGKLVYCWSETFEIDDDIIENIVSELESIKDELEEKLDNMPEQLQDSDVGETISERIDLVSDCIDSFDAIDFDILKSVALNNLDIETEMSYDDYITSSEDAVEDVKAEYESLLAEEINDAFETLF